MSLEQPRNAMSWLEPATQGFLLDISADLVAVAACAFSMDFNKHWIFATSWRAMQALQSVCAHTKDFHQPYAGQRSSSGQFMSRETAEFPEPLAARYVELIGPLFPSKVKMTTFSLPAALASVPTLPYDSFPRAGKMAVASILSRTGPRRSRAFRIPSRPCVLICGICFCNGGRQCGFGNLWRMVVLSLCFLSLRVSSYAAAGVGRDIPASNTFIPVPHSLHDIDDADFQICSGNWPGAEQHPELLEEMIQAEVSVGYLECVDSLEEARRRWPRVAVNPTLSKRLAVSPDLSLILPCLVLTPPALFLKGSPFQGWGIYRPVFQFRVALTKLGGLLWTLLPRTRRSAFVSQKGAYWVLRSKADIISTGLRLLEEVSVPIGGSALRGFS